MIYGTFLQKGLLKCPDLVQIPYFKVFSHPFIYICVYCDDQLLAKSKMYLNVKEPMLMKRFLSALLDSIPLGILIINLHV